jgi:hypothetical protein
MSENIDTTWIKQLMIKLGENMQNIYPLQYIQQLIDQDTGESFDYILKKYNHIYIPFVGDVEQTRLSIPADLRRVGLFITYINVTIDNITKATTANVQTEYFANTLEETLTDDIWKASGNWETVVTSENISLVGLGKGSITLDMLSQDILDLISLKGTFTINNMPDDEDLQSVSLSSGLRVLKFKDRVNSGDQKGRIIIRKTNQLYLDNSQFTQPNTIYEIIYNFDLNGGTLNIPANSWLEFNGGSIKNGTINLNNTYIKGITSDIRDYLQTISDFTKFGLGQLLFDNTIGSYKFWNGLNWMTFGDVPVYRVENLYNKSGDSYGALLADKTLKSGIYIYEMDGEFSLCILNNDSTKPFNNLVVLSDDGHIYFYNGTNITPNEIYATISWVNQQLNGYATQTWVNQQIAALDFATESWVTNQIYNAIAGIDITVSVVSGQSDLKIWRGTEAAYNAIATKDSNTLYLIM